VTKKWTFTVLYIGWVKFSTPVKKINLAYKISELIFNLYIQKACKYTNTLWVVVVVIV